MWTIAKRNFECSYSKWSHCDFSYAVVSGHNELWLLLSAKVSYCEPICPHKDASMSVIILFLGPPEFNESLNLIILYPGARLIYWQCILIYCSYFSTYITHLVNFKIYRTMPPWMCRGLHSAPYHILCPAAH